MADRPRGDSVEAATAIRGRQLAGTMFDSPVTHEVPVRATMRTVKGPAPLSGVERRDQALASLTDTPATKLALLYLRGKLRELWRERDNHFRLYGGEAPYVTADDADRLFLEWAECPVELRTRTGHWKGSLFDKHWRQTGRMIPSTRKRMQATAMACWELVTP